MGACVVELAPQQLPVQARRRLRVLRVARIDGAHLVVKRARREAAKLEVRRQRRRGARGVAKRVEVGRRGRGLLEGRHPRLARHVRAQPA
eukprot:7180990-Prymnesium_polylepis.1